MNKRGIEDLQGFASVYAGEAQIGDSLYHTLHIHAEQPMPAFDAIAPMIRDNVMYRQEQGRFTPTIETYVPQAQPSKEAVPVAYLPVGSSYDQSMPEQHRSLAIVGREPRIQGAGSYTVAVKLTESGEHTEADIELRWPKVEGESLPDTIPHSETLEDLLHAINPGAYHELHEAGKKPTEGTR